LEGQVDLGKNKQQVDSKSSPRRRRETIYSGKRAPLGAKCAAADKSVPTRKMTNSGQTNTALNLDEVNQNLKISFSPNFNSFLKR
jgi:hypothetical protein